MQKRSMGLLTDFYELTMMQGFYLADAGRRGVFDYFFRKQPFRGGYTVFAGLDPVIDSLVELHFSDEDIAFLRAQGDFREEFLAYLADFKFSGDLYSVKEGSIVFPGEPVMRVQGDLLEVQLIESMLLNIVNFQSLIATKSRRIVTAAGNGGVMEFGLRRAQGVSGALAASRAAYIGGAGATSNVLAAKCFGIPAKGTMAHSWVMSFGDELQAFRAFAELYPDSAILLVDTYDSLRSGLPKALKVFGELREAGHRGYGIRLDSGDLEFLSKMARKMMDEEGFPEAKIVVSNELDEYVIRQLVVENAPIDAWGVGTRMVTGGDDPALSGVYKLAATFEDGRWQPRMKTTNNPEKSSLPGRKNVMRFYDKNGQMAADLIYLEEEAGTLLETIDDGKPITFYHPSIENARFDLKDYRRSEILLNAVIRDGKGVRRAHELREIQNYSAKCLASLDKTYQRLLNPHVYKVSITSQLREMKRNGSYLNTMD